MTDSPVIIVTGLPRSGTSMMMRMLEAGGVPVIVDGIRKPDPDNPAGYYEYEPVKFLKQDSSWVARAGGKAVKVIYLLLRDLPPEVPYDVIFMRRPLAEVIASSDEMCRRSGKEVSSSAALLELFRTQLSQIDSWLAGRKSFRVLNISYNQTLAGPHGTIACIKRFLGLNLDETRMQAIVTPELYRQRLAYAEQSTGS